MGYECVLLPAVWIVQIGVWNVYGDLAPQAERALLGWPMAMGLAGSGPTPTSRHRRRRSWPIPSNGRRRTLHWHAIPCHSKTRCACPG